jgi:FMN-dependent oxidoreductase (nitrilotriacetate monooxygenase family)
MAEPKQLIVNLFEMACVSHITHGLWTLPGNRRTRYKDLDYWTELAQTAEAGGIDGIFLADVIGTYDSFRGDHATAVREGMQIPNLDPLLLVPAMAAVTRHLGFGVTFSTTYEPPFAFARRMSTLDLLTRGRIGWNIVTSYLPNAARNFGLAGEVPHDRRYEIADEYLDVLYKLWEGSWDDDAVVADAENGVYADPGKVRYVNHEGENFRVAGPHLGEPSPQRTPLLFQATGSPAGTAFAGKHAEVVFTGGRTTADFRRNADTMSDAAERNGRPRDAIRFIAQAGVVVGRSDAEVSRRLELYRRATSLDGILAHSGFPLDLPALPKDAVVADIVTDAQRRDPRLAAAIAARSTVGELIDDVAGSRHDRFFVAGTPSVVADEIEAWLDEAGLDGINLRQYHSYDTLRDFTELVVPELRRRGRIRDGYAPGETLRERVFGPGHARLPEEHAGARYRGGRNLARPAEPLGAAAGV